MDEQVPGTSRYGIDVNCAHNGHAGNGLRNRILANGSSFFIPDTRRCGRSPSGIESVIKDISRPLGGPVKIHGEFRRYYQIAGYGSNAKLVQFTGEFDSMFVMERRIAAGNN